LRNVPSSITPDLRNFSINRRMLPSAILSATSFRMISCDMLSSRKAQGGMDVGIEHDEKTKLPKRDHPIDRLVTVATGPKPVGERRKARFKDRLNEPAHHFLRHSVPHRRNAQRPELAAALFDVFASKRERPVRTVLEVFHQSAQVFITVLLEHFDRDFIDARRAAILLDGLACPAAGQGRPFASDHP